MRRILVVCYGSAVEHEYLLVSTESPGAIPEATAETAASVAARRGADWAEWVERGDEGEAFIALAEEVQSKLRHKLGCDEDACAPGCPVGPETPGGTRHGGHYDVVQ